MDHVPIDHDSRVPPFEQLRTDIAARIASGELSPGTRLPTVRQTAADLGLAVNTVARAYRELEADGVVVTQGRRGTFVHSRNLERTSDIGRAARKAAADFVGLARRLGLTKDEAIRLVEEGWH